MARKTAKPPVLELKDKYPRAGTLKQKEAYLETMRGVLNQELHRPTPDKNAGKNKRADGFDWRLGMAEILRSPAAAKELLDKWSGILAADAKECSQLMVQLLIAAESSGNWERRAAMAEAQLAVAEKELSKRRERDREIERRVWKEQSELRRYVQDECDEWRRQAVKLQKELKELKQPATE